MMALGRLPGLRIDRTGVALLGAIVLAISAGPMGAFLMFRRMSLAGDAMSHAILPGAAGNGNAAGRVHAASEFI